MLWRGAGVLAFDFNPVSGVSTVAIVKNVTGSFSSGVGNTVYFDGIGFGTMELYDDTINFIGIGRIYQDVVVHAYSS